MRTLINLLNFSIFTQLTTGTTLSEGGGPLNIAISVTLGTRSHVKYLFEITKKLTSRGHTITYLCTDDTLKFSEGYNVTRKIVSSISLDLSAIETKPFT
ncbi:hypothetical protein CONCODRAFT_13139 [Conidiobolus coronatus NRRL 28638]|uniref:Glycosyltransferase family 1 protein n=1 Tax=Conidiobolus coronatus (strain ATCC 28846 / CBS 209.66 / NRRL 28638) TaxID=796925 RepID=A0A137NRJ7_CONC2|nr:hypothetical protein CONCODRAFT_13139 [Conidiobolus coronatus NRRL 28638]|eukprot:KXN65310.1 hypothetical protein CONCODRAFT_13139 [Conidiobolus coronatus NRRL 28638]